MRTATLLPLLLSVFPAANTLAARVPLEIFIMSQCPDARDAYNELIYPAMPRIKDLVDFNISFIGKATPEGVECKHGPHECLGNMLHLCSFQQTSPPSVNLEFTKCLLDNYQSIPESEFVRGCAEKHGIDFDKLNKCVSDIGPGGGIDLLQENVKRTEKLGVVYSCTVHVDGKKWCVMDGGEWKECGDHGGSVEALVEEVKRLAGEGDKAELKKRAEDSAIDYV